MEPVIVITALIASFFLGVLVNKKINRHNITSEKCKELSKKHRDIANWLKSELNSATVKKMGKRIDTNKVKLLELVIKRLEK